MSPSVSITIRTTRSGRRYVVRYRRGGRYTPVIHAGSFRSRREALARRDFVAGELAAGRDPMQTLRSHREPRRLRDDYAAWLASRVDLDETSQRLYRRAAQALPGWLMDMYSAEITHEDLQRAFGEMQGSPATLRTYRAPLQQALDYAGVDPNPARDRRLRLPRLVRREPAPPPAAHVVAILERLPARYRLGYVVIEQTAARVEEVAGLEWGDVDVLGSRIRVAARRAKTRRSRWLQLPGWLMELVAETCPVEDRAPGRRVFGWQAEQLRKAMGRACTVAGVPHYHPHDLRHRRLSLWHGQGVPARELAERAGHSRASMSLDTYTHVMPLDEVPVELLRRGIVWSRCGPGGA